MTSAGATGASGIRAGGTGTAVSRAAAMIELGRYDEAASLLSVVVASEPDRARAWSLLSRAHLGAGRAGEALAAAQRAIAANPADHWPFRLASTALVSVGRGAEALATALEARRLAPGVWRSHVCLSQAATAAGQPVLAAEAAAKALELAPDEPDVQFTAGKVALAAGDLEQARAHQRAALAIDPGHSAAINELGRISLRERDAGRAAGYFLRAAGSAPGIAIFGRNTEIALAKVLTNLAVLGALAGGLAIIGPFLGLPGGWPAYLAAVAAAAALVAGYATRLLRQLPRAGRRHLARMLRRRHWLATVAAIVVVIDGLAAGVAAALWLSRPPGTLTFAGVAAIAGVALARPLVTHIIRASRRAIP